MGLEKTAGDGDGKLRCNCAVRIRFGVFRQDRQEWEEVVFQIAESDV